MGTKTGIEWTDATWNPIIGCSRVSEGCRNCYAEGIAGRFGGGKETVYSGLTQIVNGRAVWTGEIKETKKLLEPLSWRKPRRVFVNSMSDLFHENVSDELRDRIFAVMALCPQHMFQVLTKRPKRMLEYVESRSRPDPNHTCASLRRAILETLDSFGRATGVRPGDFRWPLPNVHKGVSIEDQATADERTPLLLQTPAAVRFISAEPMLGPADLARFLPHWKCHCGAIAMPLTDDTECACEKPYEDEWTRTPDGYGLDWVICGGESGPHARPMHPDWARGLRDQCKVAGVPFFFKQWGEYAPEGPQYPEEYGLDAGDEADLSGENFPKEGVLYRDGYFYDGFTHQPHVGAGAFWMERVGKHAAGAMLDGVEHRAFPTVHYPVSTDHCAPLVRP